MPSPLKDLWFKFNVGVQLKDKEEIALLTENNEHVIAFLEAHERTNGVLYDHVLMNRVTLRRYVAKDAG